MPLLITLRAEWNQSGRVLTGWRQTGWAPLLHHHLPPPGRRGVSSKAATPHADRRINYSAFVRRTRAVTHPRCRCTQPAFPPRVYVALAAFWLCVGSSRDCSNGRGIRKLHKIADKRSRECTKKKKKNGMFDWILLRCLFFFFACSWVLAQTLN